jgi:cell division protein FtsB
MNGSYSDGPSIEELKQYNAVLKIRIEELEARIAELKLESEECLRKFAFDKASPRTLNLFHKY